MKATTIPGRYGERIKVTEMTRKEYRTFRKEQNKKRKEAQNL